MRSSWLLAFVPVTLLLGGCPVWLDENEPPGTPLECRSSGDCAPGETCDRGSCVVAPVGPCADDAGCPDGMWCGADGACTSPPPGACRDVSDCDGTSVCVQDFCRDPADVCQFNFQCGLSASLDARTCVDSACGSICDVDADCASSGTRCASGHCVPDRTECVTSAECTAGATCFLGRCLESCAADGACDLADDECGPDGLCRPTWAPKALCAVDEDCQAGSHCVDGVCRAPCPEAPLTCLNVDVQLTHCNQDTGYCEAESERTPECFFASECPGESCVDGICRTL